jgi:hypothetical protein
MNNQILSIYVDDSTDITKELSTIITDIGEAKTGELYAIEICVYDAFKLFIETIYVIDVPESTPIFLIDPNLLKVHLNENDLQIKDIDYYDGAYFFEKYLNDKVKYVDDLFTTHGERYEVYSLNGDVHSELVEDWITSYKKTNFNYLINIALSENDTIVSIESFMDYKLTEFQEQVERSKVQGEAIPELVTNPLANKYYNSVEAANNLDS